MEYFKKRYNSFQYALKGLKVLLSTQPNFFIELIVAGIAILFGYFLHISSSEWLALLLVIGLVLITEIFNTAIEFLVDYISMEIHPTAGKIKDVAAAASLISVILSIIIGCIIFFPKIYSLI